MTRDGRGGGTFPVLLAGALYLVLGTGSCDRAGPYPGMGRQSLELPRGIPAAELPDRGTRGARLTASYCSQCHGVPAPRRHSAADWRTVTRRMFRRMEHMASMRRMMGGRMHAEVRAPTREQEHEILTYLEEHALPEADEAELPEGAGREAFVRSCSRCHALPSPGQHTPAEWPAVVERMREHMHRMEVVEIDDEEAAAVTRYLESAAARPAEGARPRDRPNATMEDDR